MQVGNELSINNVSQSTFLLPLIVNQSNVALYLQWSQTCILTALIICALLCYCVITPSVIAALLAPASHPRTDINDIMDSE